MAVIKRTGTSSSKKNDFDYEVIEDYGVISKGAEDSGWDLRLRQISWNGAEPKYDIRKWKQDENGEKMGKGISLTEDELFELKDFLNKTLEESEE